MEDIEKRKKYILDIILIPDLANIVLKYIKKEPIKSELIIPLLFWHNQDPRLAIPSIAIPFNSHRFIRFNTTTYTTATNTPNTITL